MPEQTSTSTRHVAANVAVPIAHPLDEFYGRAGLPLPPIQQVDGLDIPEPYRRLLVHNGDMTSTLEAFHEAPIFIRLLSRHQQGDTYFREVVLCTEGENKPVEFGAIKIELAAFPPAAREEILAQRWPLGRILREHVIAHQSRPKAFLKVASDRLINVALNLYGAHVLYGRCNVLLNGGDQILAQIVEILPPVAS